MRALNKVLGLICILIFPISILGQFTLPKVPVESSQYKKECSAIAKARYTIRRDFRYKFNDGKVTTEKFNDRIVKFDSEGKIKEFIYIDDAGRKKAIVVFEYYSNGLPKSEGEFHPTGEFLKRTTIKYNTEGQLLEKTSIDQYENVIKKIQYSVDVSKNMLIEKVYPFPSVVKEKNIWIYSNLFDGNLISYEKYDGETILKYKRILMYDNDKLIREEYYNPAGKKAFYMEYTYNTENLLSQIEKVLLDGTRLKNAIYQYNSLDLIIGEIDYDRYGKMQSYYKYSYE